MTQTAIPQMLEERDSQWRWPYGTWECWQREMMIGALLSFQFSFLCPPLDFVLISFSLRSIVISCPDPGLYEIWYTNWQENLEVLYLAQNNQSQ